MLTFAENHNLPRLLVLFLAELWFQRLEQTPGQTINSNLPSIAHMQDAGHLIRDTPNLDVLEGLSADHR